MAVARLKLVWQDKSSSLSETGFYLASDTPLSEVYSRAAALRAVSLPLTTARLVSAVWTVEEEFTDTPAASPDADLRVRLICLFTNGVRRRAISLRSPTQLPFDQSGPYIGIRLQRRSILLSTVLTALETISANTVDNMGRPFPTTFTVGGKTRI